MPIAMRKKELTKLRNLGNYHHNIQVLETRCGQLLIVKRPYDLEESKPEHFLPCSYYYGFLETMKIGGIVKHVFKNYYEDDDNSTLTYYNIQQKSNILLMAHLKRSENTLLQQVIASIKSGDVTIPARNNELMIK